MVESRCGIVCAECTFGKELNCAGCVAMIKPPWGEACPVRDCCQQKGNQHCGVCMDFPCELLNSFAYHEEQGDDGKRIEQCRAWAKETQ